MCHLKGTVKFSLDFSSSLEAKIQFILSHCNVPKVHDIISNPGTVGTCHMQPLTPAENKMALLDLLNPKENKDCCVSSRK